MCGDKYYFFEPFLAAPDDILHCPPTVSKEQVHDAGTLLTPGEQLVLER